MKSKKTDDYHEVKYKMSRVALAQLSYLTFSRREELIFWSEAM